MPRHSFRPRPKRRGSPAPGPAPPSPSAPADPKAVAERLREGVRAGAQEAYRERSLAIHGWVCAKCGREFTAEDLHLLTVHHRDGDPRNNPPDGSNWENLCIYCHEDEHSRGQLGRYLSEGR